MENMEKSASKLPEELKSLSEKIQILMTGRSEALSSKPITGKAILLVLGLCAWVVYLIAFFPLYRIIGEPAFALAILFTASAGWLLGVRSAVYAALAQFFINIGFEYGTHDTFFQSIVEALVGFVVMLFMGVILGTLRESSERVKKEMAECKKVEEHLRKSEIQLATAQEMSNLGSWNADMITNTVSWSDQLYRIMGFEPQEVKASLEIYLQATHPDDRERISNIIQQAIAKQQTFTFEHRIIRKDGAARVCSAKGFVSVDDIGRPIKVFGVAQDITERKQADEAIRKSELHFRSIWENSADGLRLTNSEGVVLRVNEAFCRMCEKTKEELEGKLLSVIYKEERRSSISSKHSERFKARTVEPHLTRQMTLWNGKQVWFEVSNSFFDIGGKELALLGIFRDVTDRKWMESEREKLIVELQEALADVKTLSGLVPICSSCKKIRDDKGYWNQLEKYIIEHTEAKFSHGVCPECTQKLYPQYFKK